MRLEKLQQFMKAKNLPFTYTEEKELGSIDFEYRGLNYHIWEFEDGGYGAESNVRNAGRTEDFSGDYETIIMDIMRDW
ncbi:MAG: kinase [Marvinbryantia sp.]